jgi:starch phosphorylase
MSGDVVAHAPSAAETDGVGARVPPELASLVRLALDLRWTWWHRADELWERIDAERWAATRNPWFVLQDAGRERLAQLASDDAFVATVRALEQERETALRAPGWFARARSAAELEAVAYFCMEFGLTGAIPIYAGGLGVLAGDHLKAASELGIPLIAVGLLYYGGYFRQTIDVEGMQHALYPPVDPEWLPLRRVLDGAGAKLRIALPLPGRIVTLGAWQARIGRIALYLLDSNDPANEPEDRRITGELYGGSQDVRLRQELVLGIGGWRLLRALGHRPDVCHLNEGHAAFAVFERAAALARERGWPFERALVATRAGNAFTSHTPVAAGFDRFERALIEPYLDAYARDVAIDAGALWTLGHERGSTVFNTAHLAIRTSGHINGVSRLHGEVSRHLFSGLFPRWPTTEIPVGHVTNGVHVLSWASPRADALWSRDTQSGLAAVDDGELWAMREANRARLAVAVRDRGGPTFDARALTIGWARRFAAYKRPTLILRDPERLARILTAVGRPVQIVVAGKAHPRDEEGKALLREWAEFARRPDVAANVALLADYDMFIARHLVQGVDLWLNTPRRPWEASGTSGMKVLVNGGLNLSELDGWWAEAYSPDVGWTFARRSTNADGLQQSVDESDALYELLEGEIVPSFYARDESNLPRDWLARVRRSMERLTPRFSAERMVREYVDGVYLRAAAGYRRRSADDGALATQIAAWSDAIDANWDEVRFESVTFEQILGALAVEVVVHLGRLDPAAIRVQLFASPVEGEPPECVDVGAGAPLPEATGTVVFKTRFATMWPAEHYTARVVPYHPEASVPLEQWRILWHR